MYSQRTISTHATHSSAPKFTGFPCNRRARLSTDKRHLELAPSTSLTRSVTDFRENSTNMKISAPAIGFAVMALLTIVSGTAIVIPRADAVAVKNTAASENKDTIAIYNKATSAVVPEPTGIAIASLDLVDIKDEDTTTNDIEDTITTLGDDKARLSSLWDHLVQC